MAKILIKVVEEDSRSLSPWKWRQHGPLKRWYPTTTSHGVTTHKLSTWSY